MREFQLRSTPTILTTLKEPPKKVKKKTNFQQVSFIIIAVLAVGYGILRMYLALAVIQADAQLELHKQIVHFPSDIKVERLYIAEGEKIKKGDTLFRYTVPQDDKTSTSEINIDRPIEWIQKERLTTQKNIKFKRFQKEELEKQIAMRDDLIATKKKLILIGSHNDRNEYEELLVNVNRLKAEHFTLKEEISYLEKLLYKLNQESDTYRRFETRKKQILDQTYYHVAQLDGIVGQINYNENEICYRKEELMTIHKENKMSIKAFFDPSEMKYLNKGDVVSITYPDNTTAVGVISNFHIATYALPSEFQKKYEPTERNIVADVKLLKNTHKPHMNYYKMNVTVSKNRYNL